jgi:DNA repair exonuclease SbcCD ATPase subunit
MQIESLEVNNFFSFDSAKLNFKSGLWLVAGMSYVDKDGELFPEENNSNGSGKSAFMIEALSWLFFDKTIRGIKTDDVIRKKQKQCSVVCTLFDNGKKYIVIRSRSRGKASVLTVNEKSISQDNLEVLLGVDFNTFTSAVIHPQDFIGFADRRDKERKEILTKILGLERFNIYKEMAKSGYDNTSDDIREIELKIATNTGLLDNLNTKKDELKESIKEFEIERLKQTKELRGEAKEISLIIEELKEKRKYKKEIEKQYNKYDKLNSDGEELIEGINLKLNALDDEKNSLYNELNICYDNIERMEKESKRLLKTKGGKCPTCLQIVSAEHVTSCVNVLKKEIAKYRESEKKLAAQGLVKEKEVKETKGKLKELSNKKLEIARQLTVLEIQYSQCDVTKDLEKAVSNLERINKKITELQNKKNPYKEMDEKQLKQIVDYKKTLSKLKDELKSAEEMSRYYDFWVNGFGDRGIKSFIFDSILPEFTSRANNYIQELSDKNILIEFDTQKEKKTGGFAEKFDIRIMDDMGTRPYEAWSGGEKKRISISIDLALSDLVASRSLNQWSLVIFDEMFDGLDNDGKERIVELLEKIRVERQFVYIISHDILMKEIFSKIIMFEKKDGVSQIANA